MGSKDNRSAIYQHVPCCQIPHQRYLHPSLISFDLGQSGQTGEIYYTAFLEQSLHHKTLQQENLQPSGTLEKTGDIQVHLKEFECYCLSVTDWTIYGQQ